MRVSDKGIDLIKSFESCSLTAYPDPGSELGHACTAHHLPMTRYQEVPGWEAMKADPVTIGWGHTGHSVKLGDTVTQATADSLLRMDVCYAETALVGLALNQNQYDALVSLVFNIGGGNFHGSTLRRFLKQGNMAAAARQFLVWDHSGGKEVAGLSRRRQAELALFLTPVVEGAA